MIAGQGFYQTPPSSGGTYPGNPDGGQFSPSVLAIGGTTSAVTVTDARYSESFKMIVASYQLRLSTSGAGYATMHLDAPIAADVDGPVYGHCRIGPVVGYVSGGVMLVRVDALVAEANVLLTVSTIYKGVS